MSLIIESSGCYQTGIRRNTQSLDTCINPDKPNSLSTRTWTREEVVCRLYWKICVLWPYETILLWLVPFFLLRSELTWRLPITQSGWCAVKATSACCLACRGSCWPIQTKVWSLTSTIMMDWPINRRRSASLSVCISSLIPHYYVVSYNPVTPSWWHLKKWTDLGLISVIQGFCGHETPGILV